MKRSVSYIAPRTRRFTKQTNKKQNRKKVQRTWLYPSESVIGLFAIPVKCQVSGTCLSHPSKNTLLFSPVSVDDASNNKLLTMPKILTMVTTHGAADFDDGGDVADDVDDIDDDGDAADDVEAVVAGSVRVMLGLLHHGLSGGTALQEVRQAGLPLRTEPCRLLQETGSATLPLVVVRVVVVVVVVVVVKKHGKLFFCCCLNRTTTTA